MMDHFGKEECPNEGGRAIYRFKLFDHPIEGIAPKLIGHEEVQTEIYKTLRSFERQGHNNKLVLLHGPNGSAKTTLIHAIMGGLERYSQIPPGAIYTFNWIFPLDRLSEGGMGLGKYPAQRDDLDSYAKLLEEDTAARIPCDLRDHPFLLIPKDERLPLLEELLGKDRAQSAWKKTPNYLRDGDLSHQSKEIFDTLLTANSGNFKKVIKHVQVERFFFSKRYRRGISSIEPQMHVDAEYSMLTLNRGISSLPGTLQTLDLFAIRGHLPDGNRGLIEYSDLLKRPVDSFKYLLIACETNSVNVGQSVAYLDTIMIGSSNELQLDAFKEFPDFSSFKARIKLIRVPYLLKVSQEQEIHSTLLGSVSEEKHVTPHVDWTLALWAVLSRLKKPNSINYPPNVSSVISNLTPLQKCRLYNTGEMPANLSPDERKLLRATLTKIKEEYNNIPYYEGRVGASVREIKSILLDASHNPNFRCLSPLAVINEMEEFVRKVSEYEFLKQDVKDGYHDSNAFIDVVREQYLDRVDTEVRECIGLYDMNQWEDFIKKYITHITHVLKREKIKNTITGRSEDPDKTMIREFENIISAPKADKELDAFRQNMISRVGAWSLDHRGQEIVYREIFPDYWQKLEKHYYDSQKPKLTQMHDALQVHGTENYDQKSEGSVMAQQTLKNMVEKRGYCDFCAKEVIAYLMKKRY